MTPEEQQKQAELDAQNKAKENPDKEPEKKEEEDLFDPFATLKDEVNKDKEPEKKKEDEDKDKDKEPEIPTVTEDKGLRTRYDADDQAEDMVTEYIKKNPDVAELERDLRKLASKAIQVGNKNPMEFAMRNVRPASYWREKGREEGRQAVETARKTNVTGNVGGGNRGNEKTPDYKNMDDSKFEGILDNLTSNR